MLHSSGASCPIDKKGQHGDLCFYILSPGTVYVSLGGT